MHAHDLILVTGATGNTGSALLQALESLGAPVRAMVRGKPDAVPLRNASTTIVAGDSMTRARSRRRYAHYARGEAGAVHPDVHQVTGVEPRDVRTFARDYARAFVGA